MLVRSLAGIIMPGEQGAQALEFLPGPDGGELPATGGVELQDVAPRLGGLGQPPLALEQEGAGIDRAEVLGVEFVRAAPVGQGAVRIASGGPHLAAVGGQAPVVGGQREPGVDDLRGRVDIARRQAGRGKEAQFAYAARCSGDPLPVASDRVRLLAEGGFGADPLVLDLVRIRVERDRPFILLHRPPDRPATVAFEQVAVLAKEKWIGLPAMVLIAKGPLEQRLGRQEVALRTDRLVPLEQLVLVHGAHTSGESPRRYARTKKATRESRGLDGNRTCPSRQRAQARSTGRPPHTVAGPPYAGRLGSNSCSFH